MANDKCRKNDKARMTEGLRASARCMLRASDFRFPSSWGIRHSSFVPQCLHRIDLCRASSGNPRREQPCEDENPGSGEKYNRIGRIHFKEHLLQRLSDGVRKKDSPSQAESDESQRVL